MRRLLPAALLVIAAGCASNPAPLPVPPGSSIGPGMTRFEEIDPGAAEGDVVEPWTPSPFYPGLATRPAAAGPVAARAPAVESAERARAPRSLSERGSTKASAWLLFQFYQNTWSRADGSTCRFSPTCSAFGREAIAEHGALGLVMTFGRLHRNHTPGDGFYEVVAEGRIFDPVFLHDFWFSAVGDDVQSTRPEIDAYLRMRSLSNYLFPPPPDAP